MNEPAPWTLYNVAVFVRPSPQHPKFWDFEHGLLHVFLYAPSAAEAHGRAVAVARQLPYEILREENRVREAGQETHPALQSARNDAMQIGLGLAINAIPTGMSIFDDEPGS